MCIKKRLLVYSLLVLTIWASSMSSSHAVNWRNDLLPVINTVGITTLYEVAGPFGAAVGVAVVSLPYMRTSRGKRKN